MKRNHLEPDRTIVIWAKVGKGSVRETVVVTATTTDEELEQMAANLAESGWYEKPETKKYD